MHWKEVIFLADNKWHKWWTNTGKRVSIHERPGNTDIVYVEGKEIGTVNSLSDGIAMIKAHTGASKLTHRN